MTGEQLRGKMQAWVIECLCERFWAALKLFHELNDK